MVTIEEVARKARAELDSDINLQIVGQFVSQRISELFAKTKYKALRKLGELRLAGAIGGQNSGGTVTITVGKNLVTGDGTAAALWSNKQAGQFFRVFPLKTWYRIAQVTPPTIVLENAFVSENNVDFPAGTVLTGQSYFIVPRYFAAAADVRFFGLFALDYLMKPLAWINPDQMQAMYPSRWLVGPYPWVVSEFQGNLSATGQPKMLEFYPAPLLDSIVHYVYWSTPPLIGFADTIPVTLDEHIPKELAFIPIMRYEMARSARAGQIEMAAFWRNEMRTQETKGRELVDDAIRADSGVDDLTFMVEHRGWRRRSTDFDPLTTAQADVWSRVG